MDKVRVLLFGRSGSGKSTIANALFREDLCVTGDSVKGVTIECRNFSTPESRYEIFDTVGIGETEVGSIPHSEAVNRIENYLCQLNIKLHHVCFVVPAERFDGLNKMYWITFNKIFRKSANNIIIIVTKCDEGWVENNKSDIESIMGHVPIIGVNFPKRSNKLVIESENAEERSISLDRLESFLQAIRDIPGFTTCNPNPDSSIAADIINIFSSIKNSTGPATGWIHRMMASIKRLFNNRYDNSLNN